jgi:hypothetical protein
MMRSIGVAVGAMALLFSACSGSTPEAEPPVTTEAESVTTTVPVDSVETTVRAPAETLADVLGFIEVSVRIGVGEDAVVVALAVDSNTLSQIAFAEPPSTPAWCSGVSGELSAAGSIEDFQIVMRDPAVDVVSGGAQRFELTAPEAILGEDPSTASILLVADDVRYLVAEGELALGETFTSGTFRGLAADGTLIEGAFLCG